MTSEVDSMTDDESNDEDENEDDDEDKQEIHEGFRSEVYLSKRKIDITAGMVIEEVVVSIKSADLDTETVLKMANTQFEKEKPKENGGQKDEEKENWRE